MTQSLIEYFTSIKVKKLSTNARDFSEEVKLTLIGRGRIEYRENGNLPN